MNFEVNRGEKYLITERPDESTPSNLKKVGRYKKTSSVTPVYCPYDERRKAYDTGLNEYSREFDGMSDTQVKKVLKERKPLVDYLDSLIKNSGKTEQEFLAEYPLEVRHNLVVDTSSLDNWLRLFFAMRGREIVPINDKFNPKYNGAVYQVENRAASKNREEVLAEKRMKLVNWLLTKLNNNREEALDYLRYEGVLGLTHDVKKDSVLFQTFEKKIDSNYEFLENFEKTIDSKTWEDVRGVNEIKKAIINRRIVKEGTGYTFGGFELGRDPHEILRNLKKPENIEIAEKLLS